MSVTTIYRRRSAQDILDAFAAVPNETEENFDFRAFCPVHEKDGEGHNPSLLIRFYPEPGKSGGRLDLLCGSVGCDRDKIKEAAGITRSDCFGVPMGEVAFTEKRRGAPSAMVAMSLDHRIEADREASEDAFRLAAEMIGDQALADRLLNEYGIRPAPSTELYKLGVGLNSDDWLTITARTPAGPVAFRQRRNPDPDAPKHQRWLSQRNIDGGQGPMKWDALGIVGAKRPDAPILITEGMSDAITLATLGPYEVIATRGAFGSNYVHQVKDELIGRDVILVPIPIEREPWSSRRCDRRWHRSRQRCASWRSQTGARTYASGSRPTRRRSPSDSRNLSRAHTSQRSEHRRVRPEPIPEGLRR
jgi:hypothetical protein